MAETTRVERTKRPTRWTEVRSEDLTSGRKTCRKTCANFFRNRNLQNRPRIAVHTVAPDPRAAAEGDPLAFRPHSVEWSRLLAQPSSRSVEVGIGWRVEETAAQEGISHLLRQRLDVRLQEDKALWKNIITHVVAAVASIEGDGEIAHELWLRHAPLMMAALWPRIRK